MNGRPLGHECGKISEVPANFLLMNIRVGYPAFYNSLPVDRLFERWLRREKYNDFGWLEENYDVVWNEIQTEGKPTWAAPEEAAHILRTTRSSVRILFDLLHTHRLLDKVMGVQMKFRIRLTEEITIVGAMDLVTIRSDGTLVVVDFKNFASNSHRSLDQLHFYALALPGLINQTSNEAGYLCFNPRSPGYRKYALRLCDQKRLLARIGRANAAIRAGEFKAKYNYISCSRFCDVRYACQEFSQRRDAYIAQRRAVARAERSSLI